MSVSLSVSVGGLICLLRSSKKTQNALCFFHLSVSKKPIPSAPITRSSMRGGTASGKGNFDALTGDQPCGVDQANAPSIGDICLIMRMQSNPC